MSVPTLNLADRTFDDLVEAARSRLPALAPGWTDYNLHDPGITLIELLAWVADAQIYSLARMRRDERAAYARLLGVALHGPQPATGLIWPDPSDAVAPVNALARPVVLPRATAIRPQDADRPVYRPTVDLLLVPGRLESVRSRLACDRSVDHTPTNARGTVAFEPFGPDAGPGDVLALAYRCASEAGLAAREPPQRGALFVIGARADAPSNRGSPAAAGAAPPDVEVTLVIGVQRIPLAVVSDTTRGFLRTGALALALPDRLPAAEIFTLEFRAPAGFVRPPRLLQITFNVVPVVQSIDVGREVHTGTGLPDQRIDLGEPGVVHGSGVPAPRVEVLEQAGLVEWEARDDLSAGGPDDRVYAFDAARAQVRFGNGLNGRTPATGAPIYLSYFISDGAAGNQPRPRAWIAQGIGALGRNLDAFVGGADAVDATGARRSARRVAREDHALVTARDLIAAALALADVVVARAWVLPAEGESAIAAPGTVTLVAMRARPPGRVEHEGGEAPEPARWLRAVHGVLAPRAPLGQRLVVRGPDYADVGVEAVLTAGPRRDPDELQRAALATLRERLALVAPRRGAKERELGAPVTVRDVGAWLRQVGGVESVPDVVLRDADRRAVDRVAPGRVGLVRFSPAATTIKVARAAREGAR